MTRFGVAGVLLPLVAGLSGCATALGAAVSAVQLLPGLAAVAGDTYERTGSSMVEAEYAGLQDKSFAVIVQADQVLRAQHPEIVSVMTNAITRTLTGDEVGASGFVPGPRVLEFQYANPRWTAMSYGELADEFVVDRLIIVDLLEYRLHEPGNMHTWAGRFSAQVAVVEADSAAPDDFAFSRQVRVSYPDNVRARTELSEEHIESVLQLRAMHRCTWLFFDHEEPNFMRY